MANNTNGKPVPAGRRQQAGHQGIRQVERRLGAGVGRVQRLLCSGDDRGELLLERRFWNRNPDTSKVGTRCFPAR